MTQYNIKNETTKKQYEEWLSLDEGLSATTIYGKLKDIRKYEAHMGFKCLSTFNKQQAMAFKEKYKRQTNPAGGKITAATTLRTLNNLKEFFSWLAQQQGYKSKIKFADVRVFNLTQKEQNIAKKKPYKSFPRLEDVQAVIHAMPTSTELERRNQAFIAFALLTGARVDALISFKLGDVDELNGVVTQNPEHVKTKFSKYITTQFFNVGEDITTIAQNWVREQRCKSATDDNSPLFPAIKTAFNPTSHTFEQNYLSDRHITSTTTAREVFKAAYDNANMRYYHPHTLRYTLTAHGERICTTPEEFKAWSQNLGHASTLTTFNSYGEVSPHRQVEIIKGLK